jgi:hypothetical protein
MLQQTFIHIRGIGKQTEPELWEHGIHSWDDADRLVASSIQTLLKDGKLLKLHRRHLK